MNIKPYESTTAEPSESTTESGDSVSSSTDIDVGEIILAAVFGTVGGMAVLVGTLLIILWRIKKGRKRNRKRAMEASLAQELGPRGLDPQGDNTSEDAFSEAMYQAMKKSD